MTKIIKISITCICALALATIQFCDHESARSALGLFVLLLFTVWLAVLGYYMIFTLETDAELNDEVSRRLRDDK